MPPSLLLVFILIAAVCMGVGYAWGNSDRGPSKLPSADREELKQLRKLKNSIRSTASNHLVLDSPLATIVLDEISKTEEELDNA